jgi:primosomal protein N'
VESGEVDGDLQKDLPTSNLQHQTSKFQILNSNIQHPTSNIQARLARSAKGVSSPPGRGGRGEGEGARSEINPQNYQTANRKAKLSTKTLSFARQLRQNQTEAENLLWSQIRDRRLLGIKFRRQHPVGNYILDFYSQELSLAIELDGGQHNEESEIKYDQKRTDFLKSKGVNVLRIWNNEIFENPDGVAEYLYNEVVKIKPEIANRNFDLGREDRSQRAADLDLERPGSPHPSPLPKGEGAVWVEGGEVDGDLQKDLPTSNLQHQTSKFQIPTSKFQLLNSNFSSELELIKLPSNKPLPTATIIDMKTEMQGGNYSPISRELWRKILENLERKQKIILFLNRRGLHSGLICRECGQAVCCPHCQVALAHHRQVASSHKPEASMQQSLLAEEQNNKKLTEFLLCHHCGRVYGEIASCSHCQSTRLEYFGFGTQKVETILKKRLPKAKIIRADRDTTRRKAAARDIFSQFFERDGDILIGTQIITKGFDHEAVGLVGVILADNTLQIPDFRASEKTLQNLIQASGRTGRGTNPGEVVIQTLIPNHLVIQKAAQGDYLGFYQNELKIRDNFHLPPFTRLTRLIFVDRDKQKAYQLARRAEKKLTKLTKNLDPAARVHLAPALVPKKHDKYHVHLLLYSAYPEAILSKANIAKARVDVDAVEVV